MLMLPLQYNFCRAAAIVAHPVMKRRFFPNNMLLWGSQLPTALAVRLMLFNEPPHALFMPCPTCLRRFKQTIRAHPCLKLSHLQAPLNHVFFLLHLLLKCLGSSAWSRRWAHGYIQDLGWSVEWPVPPLSSRPCFSNSSHHSNQTRHGTLGQNDQSSWHIRPG